MYSSGGVKMFFQSQPASFTNTQQFYYLCKYSSTWVIFMIILLTQAGFDPPRYKWSAFNWMWSRCSTSKPPRLDPSIKKCNSISALITFTKHSRNTDNKCCSDSGSYHSINFMLLRLPFFSPFAKLQMKPGIATKLGMADLGIRQM